MVCEEYEREAESIEMLEGSVRTLNNTGSSFTV